MSVDQTYDLMSHNATVLQCDDLDEFMYVHWTNDAKEQGIMEKQAGDRGGAHIYLRTGELGHHTLRGTGVC